MTPFSPAGPRRRRAGAAGARRRRVRFCRTRPGADTGQLRSRGGSCRTREGGSAITVIRRAGTLSAGVGRRTRTNARERGLTAVFRRAAIAALGAAVLLAATAAPAVAHVGKDVGAYHFLVGWGSEPAYAGQQNSVQLVLTHRGTGKPVVGLGSTLTVTVIYGTQQMPLALAPTFDADTGLGTPGDYRAWFIPTAPGDYTFRFTGTIGSQTVNETFTSSPTTFSTVQDPAMIEFPTKAPGTTELGLRLTTELERQRLASASQVSGARTLGIVGIVVGAIGLLVAVAAFVRRRT